MSLTRAYATVCVVAVTTVVLLLAIEAGAIVYSTVRGPAHKPVDYCSNSALERADRSWCGQYIADYGRYRWRQRYESYSMFRVAPWASATINIDHDGLRATPGSDDAPDALKIFVFGGSTMLGVGVPDDRTIPAYLTARLKEQFPRRRFRVTNYGSGWWVSTQSTVRLMLELRSGRRPDLVVFYDGINDVDSVTQGASGPPVAGDIWPDLNEAFRTTVDPPEPSMGRAFVDLLDRSRAVTLVRGFVRRRFGYPKPAATGEPTAVGASTAILDVYRGNLNIVRALGREYGFGVAAFWQPTPVVLSPPALCEPVMRDRLQTRPDEASAYRDVYAKAASLCASGETCTYLGGLFDGSPSCPYTDDEGHLGPRGNAAVATAIAARLVSGSVLPGSSAGRGSPGPTASRPR